MTRRKLCSAFVAGLLMTAPIAAHAASDSATYTYDTLGRLQKITFANGHTVIYTYDSEGNFVSVVSN